MVLLRVTPAIERAIEAALHSTKASASLRKALRPYAPSSAGEEEQVDETQLGGGERQAQPVPPSASAEASSTRPAQAPAASAAVASPADPARGVPHSLLKEVCAVLCEEGCDAKDSGAKFSELVRGSQMMLVSPKPRVKSAELQRILDECRIQAENREYERMTRDVSVSLKPSVNRSIREERDDARVAVGMLSSLFNVLLSMVSVFVAAFYFGKSVASDVGMRTLFSLFAALVVGLAESWFFSRDWLFEDGGQGSKAKKKAKSAKQREQLIPAGETAAVDSKSANVAAASSSSSSSSGAEEQKVEAGLQEQCMIGGKKE
ncbi:endoplasmic reticulum-based factor for assembly of V-ATPase-domain-containing protein [Zopfochytrium polystomum]|nr:endoplasmic reticulum-based factor for assembly of V-ATPase-domain-containing protein [Zopfochytrium polystomum]